MLAYAAQDRRVAGSTRSTRALALVIAGHALLIGAVMTARMDVVGPAIEQFPKVINVAPDPPSPPPPEQEQRPPARAEPSPQQPFIDNLPAIVDMGRPDTSLVELGPIVREFQLPGGTGAALDPPRHVPVRIAAVPRTPESALRPPYPNDKLRDQEEATLRLRLAIDERGRVTAVEPIGTADPSFLAAARRHIIRAWRYTPATEDGVAIPSTMIISLSFRLEDV